MFEAQANLWPPPRHDEEYVPTLCKEIVDAIRPHLLATLNAGKRRHLRAIANPMILMQLMRVFEDEDRKLDIFLGLCEPSEQSSRMYPVEQEDIPEIINSLPHRPRIQLANFLADDFYVDELLAHTVPSTLERTDEPRDPTAIAQEEALMNALSRMVERNTPSNTWEADREVLRMFFDKLDKETDLREVYRSIVLGRYRKD